MLSSPKPEPLDARSFRFACSIVQLGRELYACPDCPRRLIDQFVHAGTSVGANVHEAKSATSRRDLIAKYFIALREARESSYWLRLFVATGCLQRERAEPLDAEALEFVAILTATTRKLKQKAITGPTPAH